MYFFTAKPTCDTCNQFEKLLEGLHTDFGKHLNAVTVKATNSHLVRLYSPTKEPALVFFRHGVPLLFNGKEGVGKYLPIGRTNLVVIGSRGDPPKKGEAL